MKVKNKIVLGLTFLALPAFLFSNDSTWTNAINPIVNYYEGDKSETESLYTTNGHCTVCGEEEQIKSKLIEH